MTSRLSSLAWDDAIARTARAERLDAAFAILVDPQRDPDLIPLDERLTGGEATEDIGHHQPCFYDPCACSAQTTNLTLDTTQD